MEEVEVIDFYGYRGNILFPNQVTIFSLGFENNSKSKNEVFRNFFEELKDKGRVDSEYQKRKYYMIYINQYDTIIHCQLARERIFDKYEMTTKKIIETKDQDFPFVNIFIEIESQKFLIESKSAVFENYDTCSDVVQNIMNKFLKNIDAAIDLNPILKEQTFWEFFDTNNEVKNLYFNLSVPNLFNASDDATTFLNDARDNVGASKVNLAFSNSNGKLKPNKEGIDSFVKYTCAGGGTWSLKYINKDGETKKVNSKQKSKKVSIRFFKEEINNKLDENKIKIIKIEMDKIETIEKFKEDFNEKENNSN